MKFKVTVQEMVVWDWTQGGRLKWKAAAIMYHVFTENKGERGSCGTGSRLKKHYKQSAPSGDAGRWDEHTDRGLVQR